MLTKTIPALLKEKGWSLSRLARESRVPVNTIHGWINGRKAGDLNQLRRVADALKVSLYRVAFGEADPHEAHEEILTELFRGDVRISIQRIDRKR